MLEKVFGWRKASKCKKLIEIIRCRLRVLKSKRCCIANHLREDVSQLLKHGHHRIAFQRVGQIIVDERTIESYDLLDHYCQFILFHLPYIRRHRDCPVDINEAASTLIFSSPRFGELPELTPIKKLFGERYSHRFVITALELRPGNLVNPQIKDNLCIKNVVTDDLKYKLLAELTISSIKQEPLFLEYNSEEQHASCGEVQETPEEEHIIESGKHLIMSLHEKECDDMIYFDHIEELVSPLSKDGDLRLFVFKSFGMIPLNREAADYEIDDDTAAGLDDENKLILSRSCCSDQMESSESETAIVRHYSPCRHIHPKLPDYEELAAKFKAIKRANLGI